MELSTDDARLSSGKMEYGCKHYRRRCMLRTPCCSQIFHCRHCHNESTKERHEMCRFEVETVICAICGTEQSVAQVCSNCGINMGEYFCEICKFHDDDVTLRKGSFIARTVESAGDCVSEQSWWSSELLPLQEMWCAIIIFSFQSSCFFHLFFTMLQSPNFLQNSFVPPVSNSLSICYVGSCYSNSLLNKHSCVENSMRHHCSICYEYLFDSLKETTVLQCGHTMHSDCLNEMLKHEKYCCPICSKSIMDMSSIWKKLDEEIEATDMLGNYRSRKVWILCNDCNRTTEVVYHIIGQKCSHCHSYNTRKISAPVIPQ
ncbi:hypothetical protein ZIOFF_009595 [Zingiber officinale]|uniref:Uncharacterized protein n=1 Tax=Zingiber officinale TaxID=94328 RepID=A0A8J5LX37_ZINOF|nr:hypothetical protein ZIOFF_009595 [Zingiber officinale]